MLPAIVLTAGLGTRLDPLTRLVAKAAVPLAGRTLIERLLSRLSRQGVTDAVLNLHHRPESITAIVGDGTQLGLRVRYSWERTILGSAGGPRRALSLLQDETVLIVNGDTLCDVELADMLRAHEHSRADVTLAIVPNPARDHYNGIVLDASQRVTAFVPRGHDHESWHFIGIQIARAAVFRGLEDGVPAETVSGIYRERFTSGADGIYGYPVSQPFVDVGTPQDYLDAALRLAAAESNAIDAGAAVAPSARLDRCVVWDGASIGEGVELRETIVADVSVPAGFRAERAVLVPASVLRSGDAARVEGEIAVFGLTR